MDWKERLAEAKRLREKVKELLENPEAPAEEKQHIPQMIEDAKRLMTEAGQLKNIIEAGVQAKVLEHVAEQEKGDSPVGGSEFKAWGDFLYAVWEANTGRGVDQRLKAFRDETPKATKQMSEATGAAGGFLVPVEFRAELMAALAEASIVRPRATVIRMTRRQLDIPVLDQTGTTAGIPHWFGGMQFYWSEEAGEKTLTDAEFRKIPLVAHKLIGYTRAGDELLDDAAISLADFLDGPLGFAGGVAWMEDYAFFQGTGAGQPLGVIGAGATLGIARAAANAVGYADLVNMLEAFLPTGKGLWCISQSAMSNLLTIQDPNGAYVWQPNAREGMPTVLFGYPVAFTEKLPRVGTTGDVLLADWTYYLVGDRQATTIETTKFDRWRYDETSWRVVHRVDGQPWLSTPLTYQDGTTQVSPFVVLNAYST